MIFANGWTHYLALCGVFDSGTGRLTFVWIDQCLVRGANWFEHHSTLGLAALAAPLGLGCHGLAGADSIAIVVGDTLHTVRQPQVAARVGRELRLLTPRETTIVSDIASVSICQLTWHMLLTPLSNSDSGISTRTITTPTSLLPWLCSG